MKHFLKKKPFHLYIDITGKTYTSMISKKIFHSCIFEYNFSYIFTNTLKNSICLFNVKIKETKLNNIK